MVVAAQAHKPFHFLPSTATVTCLVQCHEAPHDLPPPLHRVRKCVCRAAVQKGLTALHVAARRGHSSIDHKLLVAHLSKGAAVKTTDTVRRDIVVDTRRVNVGGAYGIDFMSGATTCLFMLSWCYYGF